MPPSRYISIGIRVSVASVLVIEVTFLTRIPGTVVRMYVLYKHIGQKSLLMEIIYIDEVC